MQPGAEDLAENPERVHKSQERNNICSFKRPSGEGASFVVALKTCNHLRGKRIKESPSEFSLQHTRDFRHFSGSLQLFNG